MTWLRKKSQDSDNSEPDLQESQVSILAAAPKRQDPEGKVSACLEMEAGAYKRP